MYIFIIFIVTDEQTNDWWEFSLAWNLCHLDQNLLQIQGERWKLINTVKKTCDKNIQCCIMSSNNHNLLYRINLGLIHSSICPRINTELIKYWLITSEE